jgi:hypothetical protein
MSVFLRRRAAGAVLVFVCLSLSFSPSRAAAQVRTTGQIIGTVHDGSGAVVPGAKVEATDIGTGIGASATSNAQGGFVFPTLQPGHYRLIVEAAGFQPAIIEDVAVETGRVSNADVRFDLAGVSEEVKVVGRSQVIETTSSTVSTTVGNEQIAKLPLAGRSVLDFALLTPGTTSSTGSRFSSFNGLPGAAINLTLDGINNNSQRFRSGNTSFFAFAPVRLGAMEEVTVSTAGLGADAGAEGAVQVQFVTKRGTNKFRGQVFDQIRNEGLNANTPFNRARNLPIARLRQHEYGANLGGPIVANKLFFFGNYEQIYRPSTATFTRTILTPEAQQGLFRYVGADNVVRTANLLDIARNAGLTSTIDSYVAAQMGIWNGVRDSGSLSATTDLIRNSFAFQVPQTPTTFYPTGRVDWQVAPSLAVRGILNLSYANAATNPQFPGQDFINGGNTTTAYILSTGADWTISPRFFSQLSFGVQSNKEEFQPLNSPDIYSAQNGRRVLFPSGLSLTSPQPTTDLLPLPRNNPVYNLSNTFTYLRGNHTYTFGGTIRRTNMWESIWGGAAGGPAYTLGVNAVDPASAAFTSTTLPGIRSNDVQSALDLYALLTGRISSISGVYNIDEDSKGYGLNAVTRREAQTVGGLYLQDSWRMNPRFTVNYGLRWEFTGPIHNTNGIYTSPTKENLLGPSVAPFQPGTFGGVTTPVVELRPSPYKGDYVNPAPNVGFAWNPQPEQGFWHRLLGNGKSVVRASAGLNYYDEGLLAFQTAAGGNPGLTQSVFLNPGQPGFTPGGLLLSSPTPTLSTFPASFDFPIAQSQFTFTRGFSTVDPDLKSPSVLNWSIGLQREVWANGAVEARYVGNRGYNLWRSYDLNETNIFENGFVDEFTRAQQNLQINQANGRTGFANNGLPGQAALPMFEAAFAALGSQAAVPSASGFTNGTFITQLQQGQAGALANALAGNSTYLCRMVGSALPACADLGFGVTGRYPINVFQANPYAAGRAINMLASDSSSGYQGLQLQFRQRTSHGLTATANYTYGKATTNRYTDASALTVNYTTLRDRGYDDGPAIYDLRHVFQSFFTYELPIGRDRAFNIGNPVLNQIAGGWNVSGVVRLQSGRAFLLTSDRQTYNQREAGVVLTGITVDELQKMVQVRPGPAGSVFFLDERLIGPDGRANPAYIQSPTTPGELGQRVFLFGPAYWNVDIGLAKRFNLAGSTWLNFEALFLNAFNHPSYLVGGTSFNDNGIPMSINSTTFGQTSTTSSSPRNIQVRLQLNF